MATEYARNDIPRRRRPLRAISRQLGRHPVAWAAGLVAALYLAAVSSNWYPCPDSALYLMLGRSLADGAGYTLFGQPHATVPPGYPLLIAGLTQLGLGSMLWLNLAMTLIALATVGLIFAVLRAFTSTRLAGAATLAVALCWAMYRHSTQQLSDLPYMLVMFAAVACFVRGRDRKLGWIEAGSLLLVAGCWIRLAGAAIALAAAAGLVLEARRGARRRAWLNAGVIVLGVAASVVFLLAWDRSTQDAGRESEQVAVDSAPGVSTLSEPAPRESQSTAAPGYQASYVRSVEKTLDRPWWHWLTRPIVNAWKTLPELDLLFIGQTLPGVTGLVVFGLPLVLGIAHHVRRRHDLIVTIAVGYTVMILLQRPLLARYLLPVAPLLFLFFVDGERLLAYRLFRRPRGARRFAVAMALLLVACDLPKDAKLLVALRGRQFTSFRDGWPSLYDAADAVRTHAEPQQRFLAAPAEQTILAYLSDRPFVGLAGPLTDANAGDAELLDALDRYQVYTLVLNSDGPPAGLPPRLLRLAADPARFHLVRETAHHRVYLRRQR